MNKYIIYVLVVALLTAGCIPSKKPYFYFTKGCKIIGSPAGEYKAFKADSSGKFIGQWFNKSNADTMNFDTVVYYGTSILLSFKEGYTPKNTNIGCSGELLSASLINIKTPKKVIKNSLITIVNR